jgi:hypothetical protein
VHTDPETRDVPAEAPREVLGAAVGVQRLVRDTVESQTMHILLIDAYKDLARPLARLLGPSAPSPRFGRAAPDLSLD